MNNVFNKENVRAWMWSNREDSRDSATDCIDMTHLAESAADHFDMKDEGGPLDDETHWIWDLAAETDEQDFNIRMAKR